MRRIYIASSWKNAKFVRELAIWLRRGGHEVFDFTDTENRPDGLDKFVFSAREWAAHSEKKADEIDWMDFMTWAPTQRAFASDKKGLDWADTVILILPSGRSAHLEAGYAVGCGKELYIFGDLPLGEFDAMYLFAKGCFRGDETWTLMERLEVPT